MALDNQQIMDSLDGVGVGNRIDFAILMKNTVAVKETYSITGTLKAYSLESRTIQVEVDAYVEGFLGEVIRRGTKINIYDFSSIDKFYLE